MANCNPPVKNQAFDLGFTLYKSDGSVIANPGTLTAKISKDFGDYADIGTTSEEDTTYGQMKAALSATEMNADVVSIYIKDDTSGCIPFTATIYTCSATRGLAGTALPNAAADGAGGLPISDAGGLDLDTYIKRLEAAFTSTIAGYLDAAISTRAAETGGNLAGLVTTVAAVDAKVSALGASVVTVTSPVSVDASTVTLVCGDDYYDADGRALTFTDSGGTYPAFTAGTCKFTVRDLAKGTDTETAGTIVDANTVRFELTKTATGAWTAGGKYRFDVEVTLASGHEVTVATGVVTMLAKYSG
jgi:hypothetical protein